MFYYDTVEGALEDSTVHCDDYGHEYKNIYHKAWGEVDVYPCTGCNLKKKVKETG